jgi:hypothetical protein
MRGREAGRFQLSHAEEAVIQRATLALVAEILMALGLTVGCVLLTVIVPTN